MIKLTDSLFLFKSLSASSEIPEKILTDEYSTIIAAIIAVVGVIIGSGLTHISQLSIINIDNKKEKKKTIYEKQIEIYPQALEYILIYAQLHDHIRKNDSTDIIKQLQQEEKKKYVEFYYTFILISTKEVVDEFCELRTAIKNGHDEVTDPSKALEKLTKILKIDNTKD